MRIAYIYTHGTSTPAADIVELNSIREVFGNDLAKISSTKSLTGHSLGCAGAHEAIYCLIMHKEGFIAPPAHIQSIDEKAADFPIVQTPENDDALDLVMSNSFGFGGTNASLVFAKYPQS